MWGLKTAAEIVNTPPWFLSPDHSTVFLIRQQLVVAISYQFCIPPAQLQLCLISILLHCSSAQIPSCTMLKNLLSSIFRFRALVLSSYGLWSLYEFLCNISVPLIAHLLGPPYSSGPGITKL